MHGWPAKQDSQVSEIYVCSYFYSKNYHAFIWFSNCQNHIKFVPASAMKFSHINTREIHLAYWAVSILSYKRTNPASI